MKSVVAGLGLVAVIMSAPASAAILVDGFAPLGTAPFQPNWSNVSSGQNFLVNFTLAQDSTITSASILMGPGFAVVGNTARLKIRADVAGDPAEANLYSIVAPISAVVGYEFDVEKVTVDVAPIALAAGSYWFGLSGESELLVWASYDLDGNPLQPGQRQLDVDTIQFTPTIYNLAYQIEGTSGVIPEPATWAMLITGFGLVGASLRRRRVSAQIRAN